MRKISKKLQLKKVVIVNLTSQNLKGGTVLSDEFNTDIYNEDHKTKPRPPLHTRVGTCLPTHNTQCIMTNLC